MKKSLFLIVISFITFQIAIDIEKFIELSNQTSVNKFEDQIMMVLMEVTFRTFIFLAKLLQIFNMPGIGLPALLYVEVIPEVLSKPNSSLFKNTTLLVSRNLTYYQGLIANAE